MYINRLCCIKDDKVRVSMVQRWDHPFLIGLLFCVQKYVTTLEFLAIAHLRQLKNRSQVVIYCINELSSTFIDISIN